MEQRQCCDHQDSSIGDIWWKMLSLVQAKTVPRVYEHPPQAPASTGPSTMTVVGPKERQVCPLLRTILKRDRRSNWLTHLLFHNSKFGCCRKPQTRIQRWGFSPACTDLSSNLPTKWWVSLNTNCWMPVPCFLRIMTSLMGNKSSTSD